jgi:hypothetical protein
MQIKEIVCSFGKHVNLCQECKKLLGINEEPLKNTAKRGEKDVSYIVGNQNQKTLVKEK